MLPYISYLKYLGLYYIYLLALENGYHVIGKIGIGYILLLEFGQYAFPLFPLAPIATAQTTNMCYLS